jgi:hypothetical protein
MELIGSGGFFSSTKFPSILAALAVGSFLAFPAFADIVGVEFNGSGNGSGEVAILYWPVGSPFDFVTNSFSFSGANASGQASAASAPADGRVITAGALVQQTTVVTSNSIAIDLLSQFTVDPIPGGGWGVTGNVSQYYSLYFTLTTESTMQLTIESGGNLFSYADMYGPLGPVFTEAWPPDQTFKLKLVPGPYEFEYDSGGDIDVSPGYDDYGFIESASLSLNAKFTPIPEPNWASIALCLLGFGCCVVRQRGGGSDYCETKA